jgi:hypothetical protein
MKWLVERAQSSITPEIRPLCNRTPAAEEVVDFVRILVGEEELRRRNWSATCVTA